jgi:hypothetical protein
VRNYKGGDKIKPVPIVFVPGFGFDIFAFFIFHVDAKNAAKVVRCKNDVGITRLRLDIAAISIKYHFPGIDPIAIPEVTGPDINTIIL